MRRFAGARVGRRSCAVLASAVATKTVKIGTRGSPLALAQAYMTRDLLKVRALEVAYAYLGRNTCCGGELHPSRSKRPCTRNQPTTHGIRSCIKIVSGFVLLLHRGRDLQPIGPHAR